MMKLLNLNIGIRIDNSDKVAKLILSESPDVVTLQEVTRHLNESVHKPYRSKEHLDEQLAENYKYSFFGPLWESDGFKTPQSIERDFGGHIEQGNQIFSKHPIISGSNEFFHRHFEYLQDWTNWKKEDHGRAILVATLGVDGKTFQVITLHGVWAQDKKDDPRTLNACEYILNAAKRSGLPTIISGDLNLLPNTDSIKILEKEFRNLNKEYGIKVTRPDFKDEVETGGGMVDYIFVNDKVSVNSLKVIGKNLSDHLPLVLDFDI